MRKVPLKNYILLFLLVGITVFITCYFCNVYKSRNHEDYTTIMLPFLAEIKKEDLDNYLQENPLTILYISDKKDETLQSTEEILKKTFEEVGIQQYIVYLNVSSNDAEELKKLESDLKLKKPITHFPTLVVYKEGSMIDSYQSADITRQNVMDFFIRNGVLEDD